MDFKSESYRRASSPLSEIQSLLSPSRSVSPVSSASPSASSFTPLAKSVLARSGKSLHQACGSDGVTRLMNSCAHVLQSRLGLSDAGAISDHSADAVGAILETVLSNLTSDYERRLLSKESQVKEATLRAESAERTVIQAEAEIQRLTSELKQQPCKECKVKQDAQDEIALLRGKLRQCQEEAHEAAESARRECEDVRRAMEARIVPLQHECRRLGQLLADAVGAVRVYCRVRPPGTTGDSSPSIVQVLGDGQEMNVWSNRHKKWMSFRYDRVFDPGASQKVVYDETKHLVRAVLDGYNVCIFAYGQTGSGKTYTMSGTAESRGLYPRAMKDLFDSALERQHEGSWNFDVRLLEVYNDSIYDLIAGSGGNEGKDRRPLSMVQTRTSPMGAVPEATWIHVTDLDDVERVVAQGEEARSVSQTKMNERSSRSHQVFTVVVQGQSETTGAKTVGCLHLIDLAGSERVSRSEAIGQRLVEARHINKSLSALGSVMLALAQKKAHIPYRDSKLTQLLADAMEGNAKSMVFLHVAPEESSASETLSTLAFGKGTTEITMGASKRNVCYEEDSC